MRRLGQLFEKERDAIELIKWKEIYDNLEGTSIKPKTSRMWSSPSRSARLMAGSGAVWSFSRFCSSPSRSIHQWVPRRRQLHRHRRFDACPVAERSVVWAAFWNFVAAFVFGTAIAKTVGKGLIDSSVVDSTVVLGGLLGAIIWDLVTWWLGLPTSSSHR